MKEGHQLQVSVLNWLCTNGRRLGSSPASKIIHRPPWKFMTCTTTPSFILKVRLLTWLHPRGLACKIRMLIWKYERKYASPPPPPYILILCGSCADKAGKQVGLQATRKCHYRYAIILMTSKIRDERAFVPQSVTVQKTEKDLNICFN